jgi:hypothetical protein
MIYVLIYMGIGAAYRVYATNDLKKYYLNDEEARQFSYKVYMNVCTLLCLFTWPWFIWTAISE